MLLSTSVTARLLPASFLCASALLSAAPSAAQAGTPNVRVLMSSSDVVDGRTIGDLSQPAITPSGRWAAICRFENSFIDGLIVDGDLSIAEGDLTADGSTLDQIRQVRLSSDGTVALLFAVQDPAGPIARLRIGQNLVLEEGRPFSAPQLGIGGVIEDIIGMDYKGSRLLVGMLVRTSSGAIQRVLVNGTVSGSTFTPMDGISDGAVLPSSTSGVPYFSPTDDCQVLASGPGSHTAEFFDGTDFQFGLLSFGEILAEDGEAAPAVNSTWNFGRAPRVRINESQSSLYTGQITVSTGEDRGAVILDGTAVAVEGGNLNGIIGGIVDDFETASIALATDGTPFFTVPLSFAGGTSALMAGSTPVIRAGTGIFATQVNGTNVTSLFIGADKPTFDMTRDGRAILQRAQLATGETVLLLAEPGIDDPVACTTVPNSTGMSGQVRAIGSRFLTFNDLQIVATNLPTDSFGYLGISMDATFVANPGGSTGNLCVGPTVGRFVDQVQSSGVNGRIVTTIDLNAVPQPTGFVSTAIGDTWYCQLWHRDSSMAGPTSNFTDAVSVELQ